MSDAETFQELALDEPREVIIHLASSDRDLKGSDITFKIDNLDKYFAVNVATHLVQAVRDLLGVTTLDSIKNISEEIREMAKLILSFTDNVQPPKEKRVKTMAISGVRTTHPTNIYNGLRKYCNAEQIHLAFNLTTEEGQETVSVWNHGKGAFSELEEGEDQYAFRLVSSTVTHLS